MDASTSPELKTVGRCLAALTLCWLAMPVALHADSCLILKPTNGTTKITVSQDEGGVTLRVADSVRVSGDASYTVSNDAGGIVWTVPLAADTDVSISRTAGVVKVCQTSTSKTAASQPSAAPVDAPPSPTFDAVRPGSSAPAADEAGQRENLEQTQTKSLGDARKTEATGSLPTDPPEKGNTPDPPQSLETGTKEKVEPGAPEPTGVNEQEAKDPERYVVESALTALKGGNIASAQTEFAHDFAPYILYLAKRSTPRRLLSDAEEKRIDQQVSSTQPSTGTSVASKGSVPWLFGFAAEAGALTQSTSNNVLTFNGTPANVVKALKAKDYLSSYSVGANDPFVKWAFTPLSFSVSFNVAQASTSTSSPSTGTAATGANGTLAGYTLRYSILNHRDARDPRYQDTWSKFADQNAVPMLQAILRVVGPLRQNPKAAAAFDKWKLDTISAISNVNMTETEIGTAFEQRADALGKLIGNDPALQALVDDAAASIEHYEDTRNDILNSISNSPTIAFEYTETQQSNLLGTPVTVTNPNPAVTNPIPNLSTFNFVAEKGSSSLSRTQFTANASATIYNSIPTGTHSGRVQSYRIATEADIPLPEIKNVGMPIFTASGLFMSLINQPLGQSVVVNDVPISLTGNIWLFQSKLSLKVKDSGIKIPVALTYTNRTELNKESDVRGSIGVTYNLDSLFAKP